jgi:hypothetical protein
MLAETLIVAGSYPSADRAVIEVGKAKPSTSSNIGRSRPLSPQESARGPAEKERELGIDEVTANARPTTDTAEKEVASRENA